MNGPIAGFARRVAGSHLAGPLLVGIVSLVAFGWDLSSEPLFADEAAYYSQSYYSSLFAEGRIDDPAWLEYPAYDLPPLTKYLIGIALRVGGFSTPGPSQARAWYGDTSLRFDPPGALNAARAPVVMVGVLGCLALYGIGVMTGGRGVGLLAAALLTANPLYRLHARRAMSDVPCEGFMLLGLYLGLLAWKRLLSGGSWPPAILAGVAAGLCAGLSVLSKLSGLLSLMVLGGWVALAFAVRTDPKRKAGVAAVALVSATTAVLLFVALDPYLTAHPTSPLPAQLAGINRMGLLERSRMMFRLRFQVSADQKVMFPHNALNSFPGKLAVSVVQGFGRFGPLGPSLADSTKRFDVRQDWGALLWLPCVAAGVCWSALKGLAQVRAGEPPTAWAVLARFGVAFAVVTSYLPMAWDRYLLPIQAPASLLASGVTVAAFERLTRRIKGPSILRWYRRPEVWVFVILSGTYAYFWQSRDWNSASRLMLTYAVVERGTVSIDGLEDQTHDRAKFQGHYFSDKLPGFSLLAAGPYAVVRRVLRLPDHPRGAPGFAYWPADYWVTLGTSSLLSALTGVVLVGLARDIGCGPRRAALVALAYGLATPAFAYATMSYGHQASAFALISSFALLWRTGAARPALKMVAAGFLAAYAAVIELQVGPVAAVLGFYLLGQVVTGRRKPTAVGDFAVGVLVPTLLLLGYNQLAFGSPRDMGYFHHTTWDFAQVHRAANPLGLRPPDSSVVLPLLWGRYRGILFYAPVVSLVPFGLVALVVRGLRGVAVVSATAMAALYTVNLSYPEWTGGWSTGPRLLVPLLPFAMLPVAGLLASGGRWATALAIALAVAGGVLMLLFVAVGARIPQDVRDPLVQVVWPLWRGSNVRGWEEPFTRNLVGLVAQGFVRGLPATLRGLQFAPLVVAQVLAIVGMLRLVGATRVADEVRPGC